MALAGGEALSEHTFSSEIRSPVESPLMGKFGHPGSRLVICITRNFPIGHKLSAWPYSSFASAIATTAEWPSPQPSLDGGHLANGFAIIRGISNVLDLNALPLRLTAKFGRLARIVRVTNEQRSILRPREINQPRVVSDRKHDG